MDEIQLKIRFKLNIFAFLLATVGVLCFPQILNFKENALGFTNSIFSVLVWGLCFYALNLSLHTIDLQDKRGWCIAGVLSFLFTTAMLFGARLDSVENVNFKDVRFWISLPVLTCLFTILVRKFWNFLGGIETKKEYLAAQAASVQLPRVKEKYQNLLIFFILFFCWFLVLLAVYPGFFVYDAQEEWLQVASRNFTTHHPLLHVLLLGGIICAVHKFTDSYNLGIFCYMLFQMAVVSGVLTYLLSYLRKKKVSKTVRGISVLYFAFFPVIVMFTLCSAKDTLFTAAFLVLIISLLEMGSDWEGFFASKGQIFRFMASAFFMMMFRKNGVYAFLVMTPVILIFYHKANAGQREDRGKVPFWNRVKVPYKKYTTNRKKLIAILTITLAAYFLANALLAAVLKAESGENQEILTVPIQQLARTYKFNPEAFSPEDERILHEVLSEEALALYNPRLSDPVKYHFNNGAYEADKSKYVGLWARIGLKKPLSYLNAWLMTSYGFWYPDTVINVYAGNSVFTFTYKDSSYFGYEVELPGTRDSKIPWLDELYRRLSLEIEQEKIPILSMLYSPGAIFWCFAFTFSYALYRKKYHILMPYLLVLLVWMTVILGPTYLPRYVLFFWFGLPLFAAVLLEEERFGCKNKGSVIY